MPSWQQQCSDNVYNVQDTMSSQNEGQIITDYNKLWSFWVLNANFQCFGGLGFLGSVLTGQPQPHILLFSKSSTTNTTATTKNNNSSAFQHTF